jgi:hypothetical protein
MFVNVFAVRYANIVCGLISECQKTIIFDLFLLYDLAWWIQSE